MTGKPKCLLIILMAIMIAEVSAQNSQVLYYMNLPQNHSLNPALRPSNSVYIGLPAISGIDLNINNNFVNFSDVFMKRQNSDSVISILHPDYNVENFLAKIKDKNFLEPEFAVQLFGLGFSAGRDMYFFLDINERIAGNAVLPGDLFKLALRGNEGFAGSKIDFSTLRGDLNYYREIGVGFSRNFSDKLRIGVKGKLLFGIATASINNKALGIGVNEINPDPLNTDPFSGAVSYSQTLDADLRVNISAPLNVYVGSDLNIDSIVFDDDRFKTRKGTSDFISGKNNPGLGLDIGATYSISDKIMVSASVTDLGFIRWNKDVTNINVKGRFEYSGLNIVDVVKGTKTFDDLGQEMLDSLKNSFDMTASNVRFTTYIPFGVTLGGSYNLTKSVSLGLLSYSKVIDKQIRESLTFSANANFGNAFSSSLCYTMANNRYDNIGAGIAFRAGIFQFYTLADRIPLVWNKIKTDESTIPIPSSWNTINFRLGMNIVFGNRIKKKDDKPMVVVE
jgi:hypothetical protein